MLGYPADSNRVASVAEGGATVRSFSHDGAGNVIADDRAGTVYAYRHNRRGRLDRVSVGGAVRADYVYDGLERLARRSTQGMSPAEMHYVHDLAGRLIAEADASGAPLRDYIWLDDMPLAVAADLDTASPQLYFVHADHLDRPIRMTDAGKAVVWDAAYRPFGEVQAIGGAATLNLRFPGQYFLLEAGLHYNWHRHYDPTLGRYLQPDPLGFVDGPSLYGYVRSAPTMLTDTEGRASWSLLRWFRYYKLYRDAGKSSQEFLRHVRGIRDASRRIEDLERLCREAKGKEAKELNRLLEKELKDYKGHLKEMRQKWPEFMRDYEL